MTPNKHTADAMTAASRAQWTPVSARVAAMIVPAPKQLMFAIGTAANDAGRSTYSDTWPAAPPRETQR